MTILFEPKFKIGDTVYLKINPERKYVVDGYRIIQVNENNVVTFFHYQLYDADGVTFQYGDKDLELSESAV